MRRAALLICICSIYLAKAQDKTYAMRVINALCSEEMNGRGYVKQGDRTAANYISKEYSSVGLKPFGSNYFQYFGFPVNYFPYDISVWLDGLQLKPGIDFLVSPDCPPLSGSYKLVYVDSETVTIESRFKNFLWKRIRNRFVIIDKTKPWMTAEKVHQMESNTMLAKGFIYLENKLAWGVSTERKQPVKLHVLKSVASNFFRMARVEILADISHSYPTQNVIGYIPGTKYPDSFVVLTAHYDHLGRMGPDALFAGANDNASGVAMLMDMAKYYKLHPPKMSIAFICFAGEEAGLLGSAFYVSNPLFPLDKIRFLLNMDLMGTGENGMTVVNATLFKQEYDTLVYLNDGLGYLKTVNPRGKAANSDHYWFGEKGVRCFFVYLLGDYTFYHDVYDRPEVLGLKKYDESFKLLSRFLDTLTGN